MGTKPNTLINALIGAVVTIVLSFTMISPVLGGAAAGFLQQKDGARVGAISGLIAVVPVILSVFGLIGVLGFLSIPAAIGIFVIVLGLLLIPIYVIGLSALGGYLGVYLRDELAGDTS